MTLKGLFPKLFSTRDREEASEVLARREREFNAVINHMHEGAVTYRPDFTILSMNQAAERIFGVEAREVLGKRMDPGLAKDPHLASFIQVLFPSLAPRMAELSEVGAWPQIVTVTLEDPHRELSTTLHPVTDAGGTVVAFLKLIEDRTEREMMVASKNDFVSVAAHQLRTPLTAIGWSLESLAKAAAGSSPEVVALIAETRGLAERALKTANDLLDVTKIEEGKLEYHFAEADLATIFEKILQAVAPVAKAHDVVVYLNPPAALPLARLDENRLSVAIMNLLDNAIRYNVRGGKVTVSIVREGNSIKVTIEDTGVGIPKEEMGKLFGKLQRGSNVIQMEPNGSGLGLYIAKSIIAAHGGHIGLTSELNRGTTAWFTLPIGT